MNLLFQAIDRVIDGAERAQDKCGLSFPSHCATCGGKWSINHECQNPAMAKTTAERQAEFKQAMREAGYVRLEAYVTKEQRDKFRALGGDDWLRKKIDAAKVKEQ